MPKYITFIIIIIAIIIIVMFWYIFISAILDSIKCIRTNKQWTIFQKSCDLIGAFTHPLIRKIGNMFSKKCWMGDLPWFVVFLVVMDIAYIISPPNYLFQHTVAESFCTGAQSVKPNKGLIARPFKSNKAPNKRLIAPPFKSNAPSGRSFKSNKPYGQRNHKDKERFKVSSQNAENLKLQCHVASWCGHCQKMKKDLGYNKSTKKFEQLKDVPHVVIEDNKQLDKKHGIKGYPTCLVIKNGKKVGEHSGPRTASAFKETFNKHRDGTEKFTVGSQEIQSGRLGNVVPAGEIFDPNYYGDSTPIATQAMTAGTGVNIPETHRQAQIAGVYTGAAAEATINPGQPAYRQGLGRTSDTPDWGFLDTCASCYTTGCTYPHPGNRNPALCYKNCSMC
jgi:thiol-disulfide isomerase/thioredoxin